MNDQSRIFLGVAKSYRQLVSRLPKIDSSGIRRDNKKIRISLGIESRNYRYLIAGYCPKSKSVYGLTGLYGRDTWGEIDVRGLNITNVPLSDDCSLKLKPMDVFEDGSKTIEQLLDEHKIPINLSFQ